MSEIKGQTFTETQNADGAFYTEPSIEMSQKVYYLCEADFLRIKRPSSAWHRVALAVTLTSLGLLFAPLAKLYEIYVEDAEITIARQEWIAPIIGFGLALLLWIVSHFFRDERQIVMRRIEAHFSESPRTHKLAPNHD